MPKEKKITVFSRNGCKITKTLHVDMTKTTNIMDNMVLKSHGETEYLEPPELPSHRQKTINNGPSYERKESPLGFWYMRPIENSSRTSLEPPKKKTYANYQKISCLIDGTRYELRYPREYQDNHVNRFDTRPWDVLPGYSGIQSHMIKALYKEAQNFFDTLEGYKKCLNGGDRIEEIRKDTMLDLFGITGKPDIPQDDIKILSHGFDTKTSFRRAPEKK